MVSEQRLKKKRPGTIKITVNAKGFLFHKLLPFNKEGIESLQKLLSFLKSQAEELNKEKRNKNHGRLLARQRLGRPFN